jgi:hypothetical protein
MAALAAIFIFVRRETPLGWTELYVELVLAGVPDFAGGGGGAVVGPGFVDEAFEVVAGAPA